MTCKICESATKQFMTTMIMNRYSVSYYQCSRCGFVQTQDPYWLAEANHSPINQSDTGILFRNLKLSRITAAMIFCCFDKNKKFIDYASGYGIFPRLMRDIGFDFYWSDPYTENLLARGFEADLNNAPFELLTCFESFEHWTNPWEDIKTIFQLSPHILFSTMLLPEGESPPADWFYYGKYHGQHIAFYSLSALKYISKRLNCSFYTNGVDLHLFTQKKISPFLLQTIFNFSGPLCWLNRNSISPRTETDCQLLQKI